MSTKPKQKTKRNRAEEDVGHKWAALSRSHAMITVPHLSVATIRLVPLLVLVVIGLVLDRVSARTREQSVK